MHGIACNGNDNDDGLGTIFWLAISAKDAETDMDTGKNVKSKRKVN